MHNRSLQGPPLGPTAHVDSRSPARLSATLASVPHSRAPGASGQTEHAAASSSGQRGASSWGAAGLPGFGPDSCSVSNLAGCGGSRGCSLGLAPSLQLLPSISINLDDMLAAAAHHKQHPTAHPYQELPLSEYVAQQQQRHQQQQQQQEASQQLLQQAVRPDKGFLGAPPARTQPLRHPAAPYTHTRPAISRFASQASGQRLGPRSPPQPGPSPFSPLSQLQLPEAAPGPGCGPSAAAGDTSSGVASAAWAANTAAATMPMGAQGEGQSQGGGPRRGSQPGVLEGRSGRHAAGAEGLRAAGKAGAGGAGNATVARAAGTGAEEEEGVSCLLQLQASLPHPSLQLSFLLPDMSLEGPKPGAESWSMAGGAGGALIRGEEGPHPPERPGPCPLLDGPAADTTAPPGPVSSSPAADAPASATPATSSHAHPPAAPPHPTNSATVRSLSPSPVVGGREGVATRHCSPAQRPDLLSFARRASSCLALSRADSLALAAEVRLAAMRGGAGAGLEAGPGAGKGLLMGLPNQELVGLPGNMALPGLAAQGQLGVPPLSWHQGGPLGLAGVELPPPASGPLHFTSMHQGAPAGQGLMSGFFNQPFPLLPGWGSGPAGGPGQPMVDPPGLAGSGGVTGSGGVAWAGAAAGMNTRKRGRQSDTGSNPAEAMLKSGGQFLKNQPAASIPAGASLPVPRSSPPGKASGGTRSGAAFSGAAVEVKCDPGSQGGVTQGEPVDESEDLLQEDEDMDEMAIWRENVKIMKAAADAGSLASSLSDARHDVTGRSLIGRLTLLQLPAVLVATAADWVQSSSPCAGSSTITTTLSVAMRRLQPSHTLPALLQHPQCCLPVSSLLPCTACAGVPLPPHMVLAPQPAKDGKQPLPPTARDLTAHLPPDQRDDAMARIRREKNRLAARKCRAKKIACMQETEARRSQLEEANADLRAQLAALQAKFAAEVQMREALKNVILKQWAEPCGPDGQDASMRLAGLLLPGLNTAADVISAIEAGELEVDELKREQGEGGKGLGWGAGEEEEEGPSKEQGEGQGESTTTYLASSLMLVRVGACDQAAQGQSAGMGRQLDYATGPLPLTATTTSTLTHRTASPGPGTATTPRANGGAPAGPSLPGAAAPNHISLKRATSSLFMAPHRPHAAARQPHSQQPQSQGPALPTPAKRSKRTKVEQAAEPTQPTKDKGETKGKAAKAKPAPQPGRWLDRDCNAALNMQRIGESGWRPLELCW
ncbi:hypothetical protein QJQ45_003547 [Haematococcus lacustris]|nr:hypothetical protein QJQ45_003547 [Haematococcus lacustris]